MKLQNRVDPWGQLQAIDARGAWLGNRGILHDDQKRIVVPWRHKAWVTCRLDYQGIKRKIFSPGSYSELFFLDEATALAAGHRPCAECRRDRYNEFKTRWCAANPEHAASASVPIAAIDKQLHAERASRGGGKVTFAAAFGEVPEGAFIELDQEAYLNWSGRLWRWSASGYAPTSRVPMAGEKVSVLTPESIVKTIRAGLVPQVHASAGR